MGLVAGGIFGVMGGNASSDQKNECPSSTNCPNLPKAQSDHSTAQTDSMIEVAGFVAGGALVAAGVAMFFAGASNTESGGATRASVLLSPQVMPGGGGMILQGGF